MDPLAPQIDQLSTQLDHLTAEERKIILQVMEKDESLRSQLEFSFVNNGLMVAKPKKERRFRLIAEKVMVQRAEQEAMFKRAGIKRFPSIRKCTIPSTPTIVITKPMEDDYEFIEKLTMKSFNNPKAPDDVLPSEVPNIFESVFFEKVRKKSNNGSPEHSNSITKNKSDVPPSSNSCKPDPVGTLRQSKSEPMRIDEKSGIFKTEHRSLNCLYQDSQIRNLSGRPLSVVDEGETSETNDAVDGVVDSVSGKDDVETSEHEMSSVPETPNITASFLFPKVRRKSRSLGELAQIYKLRNPAGKQKVLVSNEAHQQSCPKLNYERDSSSTLNSGTSQQGCLSQRLRQNKAKVDPKFDEIEVVIDEPEFVATRKVTMKSVETQSDEISESGMSVLTCPASIGPVQIVTNQRIAKVLLSSESFEVHKEDVAGSSEHSSSSEEDGDKVYFEDDFHQKVTASPSHKNVLKLSGPSPPLELKVSPQIEPINLNEQTIPMIPETALKALSLDEQQRILEVARRDAILNIYTQLRVSRLKTELAMLKKRGLLRSNGALHPMHGHNHPNLTNGATVIGGGNQTQWPVNIDPARQCGRCRSELGRIMNRGAFCRSCKIRVCKTCREYGHRTGGTTDWLCTVCHKNREIQAATGEWIHDYLNRGLKKNKNGNARLFVPFTAEVKKNIKRSWTISNPSGTGGPQLQPRTLTNSVGDPDLRSYAKTEANVPTPKIAPPVFLSVAPQVPPNLMRVSGNHRNVPNRSQSMSQADGNRYYFPQPTQRHNAPQNCVDINEIFDSDDEDGVVSDGKAARVKRHFIHHNNQIFEENLDRKYKTLDPRSRIQPDFLVNSYNSLERSTSRRKLPNVPNANQIASHSLPRPSKPKQTREQSDSRSRERLAEQKRSRSHDNELTTSNTNANRRQLPNVPNPGTRDVREPTPDYDATSMASHLQGNDDGHQNSDPSIFANEVGKKPSGRFFGSSNNGTENNFKEDYDKKTKVWVHEVPSSIDLTNQSKISTGSKNTVVNSDQHEARDSSQFPEDSIIINEGDLLVNGTSCSSSIDSSFSGSSTTPDLVDSKKSSTAKSFNTSKRTWHRYPTKAPLPHGFELATSSPMKRSPTYPKDPAYLESVKDKIWAGRRASFQSFRGATSSESSSNSNVGKNLNEVGVKNVENKTFKSTKNDSGHQRNKNEEKKRDESDDTDGDGDDRHLRRKLLAEGDDFKLVFISSDSSKDSELNSSLEACPEPEAVTNNMNNNIDNKQKNMDWQHRRGKEDFVATSSPKRKRNGSSSDTTGSGPRDRPRLFPAQVSAVKKKIKRNMSSSSGSSHQMNDSSGEENEKSGVPRTFLIDDFHYTGLSDGEKTDSASRAASSVATIRTAATRDRNSPLMGSPHVPRVRTIPIRRDPLTAKSSPGRKGSKDSTESQELVMGFGGERSHNSSYDFHNDSAEVEAILSGRNHFKPLRFPSSKAPASIRSCDDRSLDEMLVHDQLLQRDLDADRESLATRLASDIQALTQGPGSYSLARSLSESDLSELCGASVSAPSPDDLRLRSLPPSDDEEDSRSVAHPPPPPPALPPKKSKKQLPPPPPASASMRESLPAAPRASRRSPGGSSLVDAGPSLAGPCGAPASGAFLSAAPAALALATRNATGTSAGCGSRNGRNGFPAAAVAAAPPLTTTATPASATQPQNILARVSRRSTPSSSCSSSSSPPSREDGGLGTPGQQFTLPETFVDEGVSFVRFATSKSGPPYPLALQANQNLNLAHNFNNNYNSNNNLNRSASSVTSRHRAKAPIAKPVRRSKSQLHPQRHVVTSIQHGGPVTLVSLSSDSSSSSGFSDFYVNHQQHQHQHHYEDPDAASGYQGSHTLPRIGSRKSSVDKHFQDDSNIVVTNRRGVRIRICGDDSMSTSSSEQERVRALNNNNLVKHSDIFIPAKFPIDSAKEQEAQNSLDLNFIEKSEINLSNAGRPFVTSLDRASKKSHSKRKYTLEELEVEGFEPSTSESEQQSNIPEEFEDDIDEEVDLSSLIEGGVDDDDCDETDVIDEDFVNDSTMTLPDSDGSLKRPVRPKLTLVEDDEDDAFGEDDELVSLEQQQRQLRCESDTEADFLDRNEDRSGQPNNGNGDPATTKSISKSANTSLNTTNDQTSDLDSVSTTSASYVLHHSDLDSMLNDGTSQLPIQQAEGRSSSSFVEERALDSGPSPRLQHDGTTNAGANISSVSREFSSSESASDPSQNLQKDAFSRKNSQNSAENIDEGKYETVPRRKKSSVSQLIARFESQSSDTVTRVSPLPHPRFSRSVTPERSSQLHQPQPSASKPPPQDQRPSSANGGLSHSESLLRKVVTKSAENLVADKGEVSNEADSKGAFRKPTKDQSEVLPNTEDQHVEKKEEGCGQSKIDDGTPDNFIDDENRESDEPRGAEALDPSLLENFEGLSDEEMSLRRAGAYTSYVFIGSAGNDDDASLHSSRSGGSGNRIVVNVKDAAGAKSGSNNCVVLQDGRASNISIVSTESSDLGSPTSPVDDGLYEPPPDLPAKIRLRAGGGMSNGYDMQQFVGRHHHQSQSQRSRGGEQVEPDEDPNEEEEDEISYMENPDDVDDEDDLHIDDPLAMIPQSPGNSGLAGYYTSSLESSTPSRRGRPPVIRAADRHRRQLAERDRYEEEYGFYEPEEDFRITEMRRVEDFGPIYDDEDELVDEDYDPQMNYDVQYDESERSDDSEEYIDNQDYPMCQPVSYDSEEYNSDQFSGDEYFDREEELRGYNRQIDFTLHTILEESGEDSECEPRSSVERRSQLPHSNKVKRHSDPSEMEKYFLYDVGGVSRDNNVSDEFYTDSAESHIEEDDYSNEEEFDPNDCMEVFPPDEGPKSFDGPLSDPGNTDDSGSVGSESDGRKTPGQKKKKFVRRERGEGESHGSEDNIQQVSSDEDGSEYDTLKRKKNKSRRGSEQANSDKGPKTELPSHAKPESESPKFSPPITPLPAQIIEVQPAAISAVNAKSTSPTLSEKDDGKLSMSPVVPVRKHKSRDSGFVGSMDDLLRNESSSGHHGAGGNHTSSDSPQSLSDGENKSTSQFNNSALPAGLPSRLEKVSEVSGEDDNLVQEEMDKATAPLTSERNGLQVLRTSSSDSSNPQSDGKLSRKDSFTNWSSDEDTNIMMNRMRAFFRNFIHQTVNNAGNKEQKPEKSHPQIAALEEQLTKLMRTVPGINDEQVREIVEYLSSEDTWSDSYDSSDYNSSDLDLEGIRFESSDPDLPEVSSPRVSNGSNSPLVIPENEDFQKETAIMYQKLMAKMQQNQLEKEKAMRKSPVVAAKVVHHISSKLVALMHEVAAGSGQQRGDTTSNDESNFTGRRHVGPPSRRFRPPTINKFETTENSKELPPFESPESQAFEPKRRMSLDDKAINGKNDSDALHNPSKPSIGVNPSGFSSQMGSGPQRRGSLGTSYVSSGSTSGMSDLLNDDERWSWKGSFESALAIGDLKITNKRKSITNEGHPNEMFANVDQVGLKQHQPGSPSASQGSRRSSRGSSAAGSQRSSRPKPERMRKKDSDSEEDSISTVIQPPSVQSARFGRRPEDSNRFNSQYSSSDSSMTLPARQSTNSLPRMGTSAIQKTKKVNSGVNNESEFPSPTNIVTNTLSASARSARYKPPGYKPAPARKVSPSALSSRKSSTESFVKFTDDNFDQWSNKSASPSPIIGGARIPHGIAAARDLVRDFRESSVNSRSSVDSFGIDGDYREDSLPRDDPARHPSPFSRQLQHAGSTTSLGSRSDSMLSIHSQEGGRYGMVAVRGEVEFGMVYSIHTGSLDLVVKQCRELAAVDGKRNRSDPYVKVYLLPDKSKSGKRKTKVKKHTLNPVFEEVLKFQMPLAEVERRTLWLSVWHSDMFGRNDFLGEVMLPLYGQLLDDPTPKWYSLTDRTDVIIEDPSQAISYRGELIVALKFVPPGSDFQSTLRKSSGSSSRRSSGTSKGGSLLILVKEAKNLVSRGSGMPDPFCKCYLLPTNNRSSKQKTPVCRKTVSPRWEHTLRWDDVTLTDLASFSLELTVWDHDRVPGRHSECLGGARFNLGTGKHRGRVVAWMDASEKEINLWQQMLDRPNFWVEGSVYLRAPERVSNNQALQN